MVMTTWTNWVSIVSIAQYSNEVVTTLQNWFVHAVASACVSYELGNTG